MREISWHTVSLARYKGVELRVHITCVVAAVLAFVVCQSLCGDRAPWVFCVGLCAWCMAVVTHDFGHLRVLKHYGGELNAMTLTPLGCSYEGDLGDEPQTQFQFSLAGPFCTLLGLLFTMVLLFADGERPQEFLQLPGRGDALDENWARSLLKFFCWWNVIFSITWFPAFPLDGGRALSAVFRPVFGKEGSDRILSHGMLVMMAGLFVLAGVFQEPTIAGIFPLWSVFTLAGIVCGFAAINLRTEHPPHEFLPPPKSPLTAKRAKVGRLRPPRPNRPPQRPVGERESALGEERDDAPTGERDVEPQDNAFVADETGDRRARSRSSPRRGPGPFERSGLRGIGAGGAGISQTRKHRLRAKR
ncbi:MAG: hypothetical protein QM811_01730 [Pirellulales bacterium]